MAASWQERIIELLKKAPGLTDREVTDRLVGRNAPQQTVNQVCRRLEKEGQLSRRSRHDGLLGNYLTSRTAAPEQSISSETKIAVLVSRSTANNSAISGWLSEDDVKRHVKAWLEGQGWQVRVAWGRTPGLDIYAERSGVRWLIEAKGGGSLPAMRVNYFISMLGELLQRMDDPSAKYSIALPDLAQFRGLWTRLPALAKHRLGLTAIFADGHGIVSEYAD